jgi:hypothetical protein
MTDCYFLGHNGLGDNIGNIGAVNYLLKYYKKIYFICKDIYLDNLKIIYNNPSVILVSFNHNNEFSELFRILTPVYKLKNMDILISGCCHKPNFISRITIPEILKRVKETKYQISNRYSFIKDFYDDINLDLSIFYNYFNINSSDYSKNLYYNIKEYTIVFLHTQSSNISINLSNYIKNYINLDNHIIICPNKNVYSVEHKNYKIAELYKNLLVPYYIDIIYNSKYIYIIDSCFSTITIPLFYTKKINPLDYKIFHRDTGNIIPNVN